VYGQSRKWCSDRIPENKISVLCAYKGNDTFYAWKNGQNLISIFQRIYIRVAEYIRERFTWGNEPAQVSDLHAILINATQQSLTIQKDSKDSFMIYFIRVVYAEDKTLTSE